MRNIAKVGVVASVLAALFVAGIVSYPASLQAAAQHDNHDASAATYASAEGRAVLVHITSGNAKDTHQVHAATMGVDHALAFLKSGKTVSIMLDVDGVKIAAKTVPDELKAINTELKSFLAEGGRVIACEHCIMVAGLTTSDMLPGVEIDSHPLMPRTQSILDSGAVVLDY
ncbi:MAG: DsrE family protein [Nitrososphaera sp.]